jgi:hypothetical protein
MVRIELADGKYTVIIPETKEDYEKENFRALRYKIEWRDLTGDGFVLALCQRIQELEQKVEDQHYEMLSMVE